MTVEESVMKLTELVLQDAVIPNLQAVDKEDVIRKMVSSLKDCGAVSEEHEEGIVDALMKRERLGTTGIGRGVAVPHTKHSSVNKLVCALGLVPDGVDFQALDGEPVYIVFLLVSPSDRPGEHLRGLEYISRHLKNQNFVKFLRNAGSKEAIWEVLQDADAGLLG